MRRHLLAVAVLGLFASLLASDARACCHKRTRCAQPCAAPVACAAPAPCAPAPCAPAPCAPRKHCFNFGGMKCFKGFSLCHKRQACAPVVYAAPCAAPVGVMPSGQVPSAQAAPQS